MRRPMIFVFSGFASGIACSFIFREHAGTQVWITFMCLFTFIYYEVFIAKQEKGDEALRFMSAGGGACAGRYDAPPVSSMPLTVRGPVMFLLLMAAGGVYFSVFYGFTPPSSELYGTEAVCSGRVLSVTVKEEDKCSLEIRTAEGEKILLSVSGALDDPPGLCGCLITCTGEYSEPKGPSNPGAFDYRLYLMTRNIRTLVTSRAASIKVLRAPSAPADLLSSLTTRIKYSFIDSLNSTIDPECAGLLTGMLFGDKSFMDEDTFTSFQKNGISHILAVSGIHVGIIYGTVNRILGNPRTLAGNLPIAAGLAFYASLAGFSPSVVRAVFMICVLIFSRLRHRRYDILSCTSFCGLVILIRDPVMLFNSGFQLSFLAVFTLGLVYSPAQKICNNIKKVLRIDVDKHEEIKTRRSFMKHCASSFADSFLPLLVIQLGMAPATAYMFSNFSIGAFFLNIPVIALGGLIIPLGVLMIVLSYLTPGLPFELAAHGAELMIRLMKYMNDFFYDSGYGSVNVTSPPPGAVILYYAALAFFSSELGRRLISTAGRKRITAGILSAVVACSMVNVYMTHDYESSEVIFLDVGQGDAVHVKDDDINILIDSGGSSNYDIGTKTLLPYFLKNGVGHLDAALITHLHEDHFGGLKTLGHQMDTDRLIIYEGNRVREDEIASECGISKDRFIYAAAGDVIKISDDITIEIIYPERLTDVEYEKLIEDDDGENRMSLAAVIDYKGCRIMMTGDMTAEDEEKILSMYPDEKLKTDVLKVAHHGSRYSTTSEFLKAAAPEAAVIQVGTNFYGHPSPETIGRLSAIGARVFRNDEDGALLLDIRPSTFMITPYKRT